ncbi:MAG: nucleoside deaminase, partial [Rhodobacteraceae bacterium]|nr:nucleoside deaminase [Paracoccaceae bacterium]
GAGTLVPFGMPRVIIGENRNCRSNEAFLRSRGVEVIVADDPDCTAFMARFISEKPTLWAEDTPEDPA